MGWSSPARLFLLPRQEPEVRCVRRDAVGRLHHHGEGEVSGSLGRNSITETTLIAAARLVGPDNVEMLPRLDFLVNDLADALERHLETERVMPDADVEVAMDTKTIEQATSHIDHIVIDQTIRFNEAKLVGANLATAAAAYLVADHNARLPQSPDLPAPDVTAYREELEKAVEAYRTSESGNFLPPDPTRNG